MEGESKKEKECITVRDTEVEIWGLTLVVLPAERVTVAIGVLW